MNCGCDATFAGMAACHCLKCHLSFADRPAYDAHRRLAKPCVHPEKLKLKLGMELLRDRAPGEVEVEVGHGAARRSRLGWAARGAA